MPAVMPVFFIFFVIKLCKTYRKQIISITGIIDEKTITH
ncbi:hypothetical protein A464_2144 [Salmonella bongori N268-08]|uniref:Uncharacterized protein n=1 Tax=Salmonella bongori N268-08 TaxID=1197719 RepID=S5MXL2_SALBN|nr:hypothetical protein A464_2144 [Salmonella bongori N268-08]